MKFNFEGLNKLIGQFIGHSCPEVIGMSLGETTVRRFGLAWAPNRDACSLFLK